TGILTQERKDIIRQDVKEYIENELSRDKQAGPIVVNRAEEREDVYAPFQPGQITRVVDSATHSRFSSAAAFGTAEKRFIDAIREGLQQSMRQHRNLVLMGQDIAEYGGVFKITEGFVQEFGKARVRNTPLCE